MLDRIADRWTTLIMAMLAEHPCRYGELSRAAPGMNPRVLSRTLRGMERDGLIHREVVSPQPPVVCYSLTELGTALEAIVAPLRDWSERNIGDILDARARFDGIARDEERTPWQRLS